MRKSPTQSKIHSLFESFSNTVIGYVINFCANMVILPLFGFQITVSQNLQISIIYVCISIVRGYIIRRTFNLFSRRH